MCRWFFSVTLAVLAVGFVFPGGAVGSQESLRSSAVARGGGFVLSLHALRVAGANRFSTLSAVLEKRSRSSGVSSDEVDRYDFDRGIVFSGGLTLRSARIKGALLKHRGSIHMAFHATAAAALVPVPKHCSGIPGKQRPGKLRGFFTLKADRLGTVKLRATSATLEIPPTIFECAGGGGPSSHGTTLSANGSTHGHALYVFASKPSHRGLIQEGIAVGQVGEGFSFSHSLTVLAPRSAYRFSADLARAVLRGAGDMRETANYSGTPATSGTSQGTLGGDLAANFAAIGIVKPFARGALSANQFRY